MDSLIIIGASYLYLVVIAAALVTWLFSSREIRIKLLKLAVIALPVSFIIATGLGYVIASPRPFVVGQFTPLIPASTDNGFPSDHTLIAAAVAAVVFAYHRRVGTVLMVLACCVGAARVLAQVHHPIDVIGSLVVSSIVTFLGYRFVVNRIPPRIAAAQP